MINEYTLALKSKLNNFKISDYFHYLSKIKDDIDIGKLTPIRIAILRSYTIEMIEPVLELRLLLEGFNPKIFWGGFNQYSQDILDEASSLYKFKPDLILLFIKIEEVIPDFIWRFSEKTISEWSNEIDLKAKELTELILKLNSKLTSQVLIQSMSLSAIPYWGINDSQRIHNQEKLLDELNRKLLEQLTEMTNVFFWDYNRFLMRKGFESIYDPKLWYLSKNPFKQKAYIEIVNDLLPYILSIQGIGKKCIVLDLDNTLWGGVAGEDGISGVALGHNYPGNCYREFQQKLLMLNHRGIILAINSKNNEEDAFEILDKHPHMVLRRKYFATYQINWENKVHNLRIIANDLNIGIDSMIFIDDNPIECELVRQQLPECTVIQLPDKPYLIPTTINQLQAIENIRLTDEDKKKGEMYQSQIRRKKLEQVSSTLDDFLKSLEMEIEIKEANSFSIPRIAQLTQKTNQFNMTTRRYSEGDIISYNNSPNSFVFSVASKDRFGDNGIIGTFILIFSENECYIDTFLLSCRVIGRTIEESMIAFIANFAMDNGASQLIGEYIPTAKNSPAKNTYPMLNFIKGKNNKYNVDLKEQTFNYSANITIFENQV